MCINIRSTPLTLRIIYINNNTNRKSNCSEKLSGVIMEDIRQDKQFGHILKKMCVLCLF